jgi:hypothetical protein
LRHTSTPLFGCVAVGAPAARAECVRLPRARGGVRPTPSQNYSLPPLPSIHPAAARALPSARARVVASPSTRVCPSLHITPPLAPRSALYPSELPSPTLAAHLQHASFRPQTPPSTSAMCCPSRPRRHWPHLALVRAPRPPAHLPHTHAPLPSSPALRPRHLLRVVVSVSRARRRRRALRGRPRRRRPPPAPPPPTTNRAAGSTPAARTPPTN